MGRRLAFLRPRAFQTDSSGGGDYPNRPSGLTTKFEHAFAAGSYGNATWNAVNGASTGTMYLANRQIANGWEAVADASAPVSPDFLRFRYPAGFVYGGEPAMYDAWGGETTGDGASYASMYCAFWMRMTSGDGSGIWHLPDGGYPGIKAGGYWGAARRDDTPGQGAFQLLMFLAADTANATEFYPYFLTQGIAGDQQAATLLGGLTDNRPVKVDQWHRYEWFFEAGTVAGTTSTVPPIAGDGRVRLWLDGTPVIDKSDMVFRTATYSDGLWGRRHGPVLGGNNPAISKNKTDYLDVSHELIAVGAQVEP